jgi:predicted O-linked N-acetylglucosamine transferase (SPINDLY family)
MDASKTINDAVRAFRAGRGDEGQQLLEKVLKYQPTNQQAVGVLAQIQQQSSRALVSVETLRHVAEAQPQNPAIHELLANFLVRTDPRAAETSARAALKLAPSSAAAHSLLGETLLPQQRYQEAAQAFQLAARMKPTDSYPVIRLAEVMRRAGRGDDAVNMLRNVLPGYPKSPEVRHALGQLLLSLDRAEEAETAFREAITVQPQYASGHGSLGMTLQQLGRLDEAEQVFRAALNVLPEHVLLHVGLAHVLVDAKKLGDAEATLRRALELNGRSLVAMTSLSVVLNLQGRLTGSAHVAQRAAQGAPNSADANATFGHALHRLGLNEQATQFLLRGWQLGDSPAAGSSFLHHLNYLTNVTPADVFKSHRAWAQRYADRIPLLRPHPNDRDPERRLKVGYVSADLRRHAVSHFVEPLLGAHDRERVEVFCYSAVRTPDDVTARLRSRVGEDHWRDIARVNDNRAAEMIRADGIDVLIDLSGHTEHNRLLVFARRPAPVQATYQGYPNTTGMNAMAYRISDAHADPPGMTEPFNAEQLVRLPRTAWCYQPPEPAPDVSDLPARRNGRFTFGSFNRLAKIGGQTVELWGKVLSALPESRLLLKTAGFGEEQTQKNVREMFAKHGVAGDRLELRGPDAAQDAHLAHYAEMDLALDCFPYHGTTTSCEAMWMGVPSVTLVGDRHVSRVGLSLLTNVGLPEFAADSAERFVELAVEASRDLDRLAELRRTMRDRMRASALMDAAGFARELEDACRDLWRTWCATPPPGAAPASMEGGWQPVEPAPTEPENQPQTESVE